jgi:tetratricopeptide (TPR) repeat protein
MHHFPCIFNLACVYSSLDKHANAKKWFTLASKIKPNSTDAYYGSALSSFKQKSFLEAFNVLKNMPSTAKSLNLRPEDLTYFKALCLKKLHNFKKAEEEYVKLQRQFQRTEGQRLVKYIFGIIVLPLQ